MPPERENKTLTFTNFTTIIVALLGSITTIVVTIINVSKTETQQEKINKTSIDIQNKVEGVPVGTIIASYLTFEELNSTIENTRNKNGIWKSSESAWAPADGRSVSENSRFYELTKSAKLPDLRGVFLRGLNQFDLNEHFLIGDVQKDPENRKRGHFQTDALKIHDHPIEDPGHAHKYNESSEAKGSSGKGGNDMGLSKNSSSKDSTNIKVKSIGDDKESRPKNVAIYYYIKIN